jgi:hypothetical protein
MLMLFGRFIVNSSYHDGNGSMLIVFQFKFFSKKYVLFSSMPFDAPASIMAMMNAS